MEERLTFGDLSRGSGVVSCDRIAAFKPCHARSHTSRDRGESSLLLYYSRPRVEWYKSLWALNTSPPWNCIHDQYPVGPFIRPICTRCCFMMTDEIQVCSSFDWALVCITHTRPDEVIRLIRISSRRFSGGVDFLKVMNKYSTWDRCPDGIAYLIWHNVCID